MSASTKGFLACMAVVGTVLATTPSDANAQSEAVRAARNVVGVWHCDVDYTVPLPPFQAVLEFSKDRNVSIVGSHDDDGLIIDSDVLPEAFATSKTPAYGRWAPSNRRRVNFTAIYYDTKGLQSGDDSGVANNITRLNCKAFPGRNKLDGSCTADIFLPNSDPIDGKPIVPGDAPIFEASCKRLTVD